MSVTHIVLTGGPCAGKSTGLAIIEQKLKDLGYDVIMLSEMATQVMESGITPSNVNSKDFQSLLVKMQVNRDKAYSKIVSGIGAKTVILYDRGIMDGAAYCTKEEFNEILDEMNLSTQEIFSMYDGVFHLVSAAIGAPEAYSKANNKVRIEDIEQAVDADKRTLDCWVGHPHLRVINNEGVTFDQKITNLIKEILSLLGEPIPMEIERKFLVRMPNIPELQKKYRIFRSEIIQTYLESTDGVERRVRQRGNFGDYSYYYTEKCQVEFGTRQENEKVINQREYLTLLMEADTTRKQIRKTRYCMVYKDRYFELDIYPFWKDEAILEIEVNDINDSFEMPPEIKIIKEVTGDKSYSNFEIAGR